MNIWWIRRDLRLSDNPTLTAAMEAGTSVVPVFILDPRLLAKPAVKRQAFLFNGLWALAQDLEALGSGLIVRQGDPAIELPRLAAEINSGKVFAEADISPYARRRDTMVAKVVDLQLGDGLGIHPADAVVRPDGKPYTVFTPYSRAWKALPYTDGTLPRPKWLPHIPNLRSDPLPDLPEPDGFPPGEREAQRRLELFLDGPIYCYGTDRDRMDLEGTSSLSLYLRFGMLSARQALAGARGASDRAPDSQAAAGCQAWINELIWREFYQSILFHFPFVSNRSFQTRYRNLEWRTAPEELQAWQEGRSGYPIVDAGMRQLAETGWMHNRARMITASFLVKHLLINWREGEKWFMRQLIDGDLAANNGGWQWTAGTGTDSAPYFRIFNPTFQAKKFDPEGEYIRRWVPELASVTRKHIHAPWQMPRAEQQASNVEIGKDYPFPIVEHDFARRRALEFYRSA
jgi:deoxyribodipyrimidine photo-lyase